MRHRVLRFAIGAAIFIVLLTNFTHEASAALLPKKILIPTAKVSADIVKIGITKTGNLDVPPNYYQAGWYKYGSLPGELGNVVIDGHVDNGAKIPGPFKNLKKIKVGDEISILMNDGSKVLYEVTDASVYATKAFPGKSVFHGDGTQSVLKIITCHGNYIEKDGTYDHRLIVTAVRKLPSSIAAK